MATIRQLEEALAKQPPPADREVEAGRSWNETLGGVVAWEAELRSAPVVTRDAVLAVLEEARVSGRWARRTFWVALAALVVSIVAVAVALLGG